MNRFLTTGIFTLSLLLHAACTKDPSLREQVVDSLRKASDFFRTHVSTQGGYVWRYSEDLTRREGERKATTTMAWVQPPGTPSVGIAYLSAYEATSDPYYIEAAREAAYALVNGQLRSGGWDYHIEFNPQRRKLYAYRVDTGNEGGRNLTTLDDDTTQAALRLLMKVDKALDFKDQKIHEAAKYALQSLLKAQYPNGAWPQRYDRFPEPEEFPIRKASYPPSWFRSHPDQDYRSYYTFNDNTITDTIRTMLEASRIYGEVKYKEAAEKAGGFILLAQMPEPQPAWAQQYDEYMYPSWARKFEPPAITGGESQEVMRTLLLLYRETGNKKFLEPLPRAIRYLRRSRLPDGRLARFYELKTNKPLFFTRDYQLTYSDADPPTHYAFKTDNGIDSIAQEYERLKGTEHAQLRTGQTSSPPQLTQSLIQQTKQVLATLDEKGRWLDEGIIDSGTFIKNIGILSTYLTATGQAKKQPPREERGQTLKL